MITYAMSSVGICARTLSATRLGLLPADGGEPPEYLRLAAREGSRHEQWIKDDLPEHGYKSIGHPYYCDLCGRYGIHIELVKDLSNIAFKFIGHIDDYVYPINNPGHMHIAEYKALGKYMNWKLEDGIDGHRTYATQVSLYYYAQAQKSALPILYVIKNRDTGKMTVRVFEEPPIVMDTILSRLSTIENYVAKREMAPCDADREGPDKYHCTALCDEGAKLDMPVPETVNAEVNNYRTALALEAEIAGLKTVARGVFSAYVQASGKKSIRVDGMTITWVPDGVRRVYDVPEEVKKAFEVKKERPGYLRVVDNKEG